MKTLAEKKAEREAQKKRKPKGPLAKPRMGLSVTSQARIIAERKNINPLEVLLDFCAGDWKKLGYESGIIERVADGGMVIEMERITPQMRLDAAKTLVPFIYPKLKAVDMAIKDERETKPVGSYEEFILTRHKERKALKRIDDAEVIDYDKLKELTKKGK